MASPMPTPGTDRTAAGSNVAPWDADHPRDVRRVWERIVRHVPVRQAVLAYAVLIVGAAVVGLELARPFRGAGVAFDSQVSVLHFDRLITGRMLEEATTTTAKPLLTAIYGLLHHATGGWHAIAYATLGAYVVGAVGMAALAGRLAGPAAAVFAGVGTAMSAHLLHDAALGFATPWALPCWVGAGMAVSGKRPRYAAAGALLAVATLARLETLVLTGAIVVVLTVLVARARFTGSRPVPIGTWRLPLVALGAVPVLGLHDLLLTGDPLYWTRVATIFSQTTPRHVPTPVEVLGLIAHGWGTAALLPWLAAIGLIRLARDGRWSFVVALLALGPLILVALVVMAARGIYVDDRYLAAPHLAVILLASVGFMWVVIALGRFTSRWPLIVKTLRRSPGLALAGGAIIALAVVQPYWWQDASLRGTVRRGSELGRDTDRAVATLREVLKGPPDPSLARGSAPVIVPSHVRFRVVLDLGAREGSVGGLRLDAFDLAGGYPGVGQVVYHHRHAAPLGSPTAVLETTVPTEIGGVILEPVMADPSAGLFVVRVAAR